MERERFSDAEFERRWHAVRARLEGDRIDALAVTSRAAILYLTGHDPIGTYEAPFVLIVTRDLTPVFVVRAYDERTVRADVGDGFELRGYFGRLEAMSVVADALRGLGLGACRIGAELDCWGLAPMDVERLRAELPGLDVVDASSLVRSVAEVHSAEEIDVLRAVMRWNDLAIRTFFDHIREGESEVETLGAMERAVTADGGGFDPSLTTVLFGARTGLPHGTPTAYRLQRGDVAFTEVGAFSHGYSTGLCRTAVLGSHPEAERLHEVAEEATRVAVEAIRPGVTAASVHLAVSDAIGSAGRASTFLQRTGYTTGAARFDRGFTSLEPASDAVLVAGMTFHMPRILFDEDGRFGVGTGESVLVTDDGAEVLSTIPRGLLIV